MMTRTAVLAAVLAAGCLQHPERTLRLHVDGEDRTILTFASGEVFVLKHLDLIPRRERNMRAAVEVEDNVSDTDVGRLRELLKDAGVGLAGEPRRIPAVPRQRRVRPPTAPEPKVEMVFVVDTTGSMGGLIAAAKQKIWLIINEIASAKPTPTVKTGFVIYRDRKEAYVTKVFDLMDDLEKSTELLKGFDAADGGDTPEDVNKALQDAVQSIHWSRDRDTYRVVFLVGDAPPHVEYDDVQNYKVSLRQAVEMGITVNAIRCGTDADCERYWREIAELGHGRYFSIPQTGGTVAIGTPYDTEIARCASEIGGTTIAIPGRAPGMTPASATGLDTGAQAERAGFYAKSVQAFRGWDLVTECLEGRIDAEQMSPAEIPDALRGMSPAERVAAVEQRIRRRQELVDRILDLEQKRREHLRKAIGDDPNSFDVVVLRALKEQAARKGLRW